MSKKRTWVLEVKKVKEILRLKSLGLSQVQIARSCHVSRFAVQDYLMRAAAAGIHYPLSESYSEDDLLRLLGKCLARGRQKAELDYSKIHRELRRKGVTLELLWQEYIKEHPEGYSYSQFCALCRKWRRTNDLPMRQTHKAGEKAFIDYTGVTVPIYERLSGKVSFEAEVFVAALGASSYTFAEATASQQLKHWLGSHVRAFEFFGGVTEILIPDNLASGVKRACRYEPEINRNYRMLAQHYATVVIPARVKKPRDKAKVENAVQQVERWVIAPLRNQRFYSLHELNTAMKPLLRTLNNKLMKEYGLSRKQLFEQLDKPALKSLPTRAFRFATWSTARVNIDYHIEVKRHYYSVPCQHIRQKVDLCITENTIEVFLKGKRIALHKRSNKLYQHTTVKEHMPKAHQQMLDWTPSYFLNTARKIGPEALALINAVLGSRAHPEQSYRSCLGLLRLAKKVENSRFEAACKRANFFALYSFKSVKSILETGQDRLPLPVKTQSISPLVHENIRGNNYFSLTTTLEN